MKINLYERTGHDPKAEEDFNKVVEKIAKLGFVPIEYSGNDNGHVTEAILSNEITKEEVMQFDNLWKDWLDEGSREEAILMERYKGLLSFDKTEEEIGKIIAEKSKKFKAKWIKDKMKYIKLDLSKFDDTRLYSWYCYSNNLPDEFEEELKLLANQRNKLNREISTLKKANLEN